MGISEPIWYISILVTFFVCLAWVNTPSHGRNISSEYYDKASTVLPVAFG